MKIFLTGYTGLLGSNFLHVATEAGHEVTCVRREWADKLAMMEIDWGSFDAVVHLAAAGVRRDPPRDWIECVAVNFHALRRLLAIIGKSGATPRIFIAGSIREQETGSRPSLWSDPYTVSKKIAGLFVKDWANQYKGSVVYWNFEPFYAPGEAEKAAKLILSLL